MTLTEFKLTLPLILELSLEVSGKLSDRSLMAHQRSLMAYHKSLMAHHRSRMAHHRSPIRGSFSSILEAFWKIALSQKI